MGAGKDVAAAVGDRPRVGSDFGSHAAPPKGLQDGRGPAHDTTGHLDGALTGTPHLAIDEQRAGERVYVDAPDARLVRTDRVVAEVTQDHQRAELG